MMTDKEFRALARILREEELSTRTQWLIVSGIWVLAVVAVAIAYLS
jgi:hypothetical protein